MIAATSVVSTDASHAEARLGLAGDRGGGRPRRARRCAVAGRVALGASHRVPRGPPRDPADQATLTISAVPGGPAAAPLAARDASWLEAGGATAAPGTAGPAAVPGGVGDELGKLLGARDLTPPIVALSLLLAARLGAVHAVSPGHGKTVMAAYLVGSRGTAHQAPAWGSR